MVVEASCRAICIQEEILLEAATDLRLEQRLTFQQATTQNIQLEDNLTEFELFYKEKMVKKKNSASRCAKLETNPKDSQMEGLNMNTCNSFSVLIVKGNHNFLPSSHLCTTLCCCFTQSPRVWSRCDEMWISSKVTNVSSLLPHC